MCCSLLLAGLVAAMLWAKARDPFQRIEFSVGEGIGRVSGIVILPKPVAKHPTVIYLYGSGGNLLGSGRELRQLAEMGLAAVGIEYNQRDQAAFDEQFRAVQAYVARQPWALEHSTAWMGFSLGAQRTLAFAVKHPELQPKLLVRLAGGWIKELEVQSLKSKVQSRTTEVQSPQSKVQSQTSEVLPSTINSQPSTPQVLLSTINSQPSTSVLLIHGEQDEIFPVADCRRVAEVLRDRGMAVDLRILPGLSHAFGEEQAVVLRVAAEYCAAKLPRTELEIKLPVRYWPAWTYWLTAVLLLGSLVVLRRWLKNSSGLVGVEVTRLKSLGKPQLRQENRASLPRLLQEQSPRGADWFLKTAAILLCSAAVLITAMHLIPPRLPVGGFTLDLAAEFFVPARLQADFAFVTQQAVWRGRRLGALLDHVELADLQRKQFYPSLDSSTYQACVLSPNIDRLPLSELDWRRPLWEHFYPRVRNEHDPLAGAQTIVRSLRERVGINSDYPYRVGVESIWTQGMADAPGFERIYVAALRSVGIAAQLGSQGQAEFWSGTAWQPAPRPLSLANAKSTTDENRREK